MKSFWNLLYEASRVFLSQRDEETILDTVCDLAVNHLSLKLAWIGLVDEGSYVVHPVAVCGSGKAYLDGIRITWDDSAKGRGPTGQAIRTGQATVTNQIERDPDFAQWRSRAIEHGLHSSAAFPLLNNDQVLGTLNVYGSEANHFTVEYIQVLQSLANLTATALSSARLFKAQQTSQKRYKALQVATEALIKALGLEQVLQLILSELQQVVPYDTASVMRTKGDRLEIVGSHGFPDSEEVKGITFDLVNGDNPNRTIAQSHRTLILHDPVKSYDDFALNPYTATIRSWLGVPLLFGDQLIGMLSLDSHKPNFYTEEHAQLALDFATRAAIAIENAQLYDQLRAYAAELEERVAIRTKELEEANLQLMELDRLKSKFVSDVSHELRTPVTNLMMYLDLINVGNPDKNEKYRAVLKNQTKRLAQLIESILDLSRLDTDKDKMVEFESVNLNDLVEQIVIAHIPRAEMAGLQLVYKVFDELPLIRGVRSQLAQVATNLLANALNYTKDGYIRVSTYMNSSANQVCLEVKDSGIGIPSKDIKYIFSRFYRGLNVSQSNFPGSGLGLAIAQEIVELHQGRIDVESVVGVGSTFRVWLPVDAEAVHRDTRQRTTLPA